MKKLVGYLTPKLPNTAFTIDLANALFEAGMDALELGVPFSDPAADGETIERAGHIAIANGYLFDDSLEIARALKGRDILLMGYMNSFYKRGFERVAKEAAECGISGVLIPDLPYEEAGKYARILGEWGRGVALISFVAPTTPKERIKTIVREAKKFIYLVAYTGVTGKAQSEDLGRTIEAIREASKTDIFVGFGVNRNTAKERVKGADGVIVGSEFVKVLLDDSLSGAEKIKKICGEARAIKELIG